MKNPNSHEWSGARSLEDMLALLADIDDDRKGIKQLAFTQGDAEIFRFSQAQRHSIGKLRQALSDHWQQIQDIIND